MILENLVLLQQKYWKYTSNLYHIIPTRYNNATIIFIIFSTLFSGIGEPYTKNTIV